MNVIVDPKAKRIVADVLATETSCRRQLVVALSGAHAYGFPSPDSDYDLKAVHFADPTTLLGLREAEQVFDRLEVIEGIEIDYTSNEAGGVLIGLLNGNGNYLERILGEHLVYQAPELESLKPLAQASISKRYFNHYRGFASSQRKAFEAAATPSAKVLLYVLRTALTGVHLMRTGELVVDLTRIAERYGYGEALRLVEAKRAGERTVLEAEVANGWRERLDGLFAELQLAFEQSSLVEAAVVEPLDAWLVDIRRGQLGR